MRQKDNQICISIFILHAIMHSLHVVYASFDPAVHVFFATLQHTSKYWQLLVYFSVHFPIQLWRHLFAIQKKRHFTQQKKIQIISAAAYIILYVWRFMGQIRDSQVCFARMDYTHCYNYNNQLHCLCRVYTLHVLLLFIFLFFCRSFCKPYKCTVYRKS